MDINTLISNAVSDNTILRPREAVRMLGISRASLYRFVRLGLIPAPIKLGLRATGWKLATLKAFLDK